MSHNIPTILEERGERYGDFGDHAKIAQGLKGVMQGAGVDTNWERLSAAQKESLEMIAHKIGRILNGDPNYDDSWVDIAGYAHLIVQELE